MRRTPKIWQRPLSTHAKQKGPLFVAMSKMHGKIVCSYTWR